MTSRNTTSTPYHQKNILITGPSSGIGRDLAVLFAKDGANLILVSRNHQKLDDLKHHLEDQYGVEAHVIAMDLSLPGSAEKLVRGIDRSPSRLCL